MLRMSTALPVVPGLGPGQHSLNSILPGQRHSILSCDGWGVPGYRVQRSLGFLSSVVRGALAWPMLSPSLFGPNSDDRALAGAGGQGLGHISFSLPCLLQPGLTGRCTLDSCGHREVLKRFRITQQVGRLRAAADSHLGEEELLRGSRRCLGSGLVWGVFWLLLLSVPPSLYPGASHQHLPPPPRPQPNLAWISVCLFPNSGKAGSEEEGAI